MSHPTFQTDPSFGRWIENCSQSTADWNKHCGGFEIGPPAYPTDCDDKMRENISKMVGLYDLSGVN